MKSSGKFLLALLVGLHLTTAVADDMNAEIVKAYREELVQEIKDNFKLTVPVKPELTGVQVEQKHKQADQKQINYFSILGLIINDAMGQADEDLHARTITEAGRIK